MMFFLIVCAAVTVLAEPPISKSYLPPSRGYQGTGSPRPQQFPGAPEVVAARFNRPGQSDELARNSLHDPATGSRSEGYDSSLGRNGENREPANYNFGYMVSDDAEGTDFGHHEARQEETAQGEYHVVLPDGRKQTVSYQADERGFKPQISYQETEDIARLGYDSNAREYQNGARGNHGNGLNHDLRGNDIHGNGVNDIQRGVHGNARSNGY